MDSPKIDFHLLGQTILYFAIAGAGMAAAISMGLSFVFQDEQYNSCILYGSAEWKVDTGLPSCVFKFDSQSVCNFNIWILVLLCVIYPLSVGSYYGYATHKSRTDKMMGCSDVQRIFLKKRWKNYHPISDNVFTAVTVAQDASWIAFFMWVLQLILTVLRFMRNRRLCCF